MGLRHNVFVNTKVPQFSFERSTLIWVKVEPKLILGSILGALLTYVLKGNIYWGRNTLGYATAQNVNKPSHTALRG